MAKQLEIGVEEFTEKGRQKSMNEDHYGNEILENTYFILADGMSGYDGKNASETAVEAASETLESRLKNKPEEKVFEEAVLASMKEANKRVISNGSRSGTTLDVVAFSCEYAHYSHVGDSRIYVMDKKNNLSLLTHDQIKDTSGDDVSKNSTEMMALSLLKKYMPSNWVGKGKELADIKFGSQKIDGIKYILMATDGLTDLVTYDEIKNALSKDDIKKAAKELMDIAQNPTGFSKKLVSEWGNFNQNTQSLLIYNYIAPSLHDIFEADYRGDDNLSRTIKQIQNKYKRAPMLDKDYGKFLSENFTGDNGTQILFYQSLAKRFSFSDDTTFMLINPSIGEITRGKKKEARKKSRVDGKPVDGLRNRISGLESQLRDRGEEYQRVCREKELLDGELGTYKSRIVTLEQDLSRLKAARTREIIPLFGSYTSQMQQLKVEFISKEAKVTIDILLGNYDENGKRAVRWKDRISSLSKYYDNKKTNIDTAEKEVILKVVNRNRYLKRKYKAYLGKIGTAINSKSKYRRKPDQQIQKLTKENEGLHSKVDALSGELRQKSGEIGEYKRDITKLKRGYGALQSRLKSKKPSSYDKGKSPKQYERKVAQLGKQIEGLESENKRLSSEKSDLGKKISKVKDEYDGYKRTHSHRDSEYKGNGAVHRKRVEELKGTIDQIISESKEDKKQEKKRFELVEEPAAQKTPWYKRVFGNKILPWALAGALLVGGLAGLYFGNRGYQNNAQQITELKREVSSLRGNYDGLNRQYSQLLQRLGADGPKIQGFGASSPGQYYGVEMKGAVLDISSKKGLWGLAEYLGINEDKKIINFIKDASELNNLKYNDSISVRNGVVMYNSKDGIGPDIWSLGDLENGTLKISQKIVGKYGINNANLVKL